MNSRSTSFGPEWACISGAVPVEPRLGATDIAPRASILGLHPQAWLEACPTFAQSHLAW
jgi:hypothetical protein